MNMKRKNTIFYLILITNFVWYGCSNNQSEYTLLKYYENSSIQTQDDPNFFLATVENGNNLVFEYEYVLEADPDIADSGFSETILFEIDPSLEEFSYTDQQLEGIKTYYRHICFCASIESILVNSGSISGTKINNNLWNIDININYRYEQSQPLTNKQFSGVFTLSTN